MHASDSPSTTLASHLVQLPGSPPQVHRLVSDHRPEVQIRRHRNLDLTVKTNEKDERMKDEKQRNRRVAFCVLPSVMTRVVLFVFVMY
ncbi:unnamed protein product [Vicia faba]|uniref:Transmembrane protein n=1 Tax=Vicia faba TaxID=3906 RepID=A0AAV0ZLR2_VICFA|nr:unnamed protein product [Vicia faba]